MTDELRPGYATTPSGRVHFVEAGAGAPILLVHQTPRSWDEYRELLPLLAPHRRAIAMDTIGFGASDPPASHAATSDAATSDAAGSDEAISDQAGGPGSIESYAQAALELLDALGIGPLCVLGHHTGGVVAIEMAARRPHQVRELVLSSTPFMDADARARRELRPPIDEVPFHDDGHHLALLWQGRQRFYPEGRPDLLTRFVIDALRAGPNAEAGHQAVGRYRMEERIGLVDARTMLIGASDDSYSFPELERLAAALDVHEATVIEGGMVPLMEMHADEVAARVLEFLDERT